MLELRGGDTTSIEAKTFSEYTPEQLGPTLGSFANKPGGGVILLGVSERDGINVVGVDDVDGLLKRAANQARNGFSAPIRVDVRAFDLDGKAIGVVNVEGANVNEKPVRWLKDKKAYLRQYDGDYQMAVSEEQMLLLRHRRPLQTRTRCVAVRPAISTRPWCPSTWHPLVKLRRVSPTIATRRFFTTRALLRIARAESCRLPVCMRWASIRSVFSRT